MAVCVMRKPSWPVAGLDVRAVCAVPTKRPSWRRPDDDGMTREEVLEALLFIRQRLLVFRVTD